MNDTNPYAAVNETSRDNSWIKKVDIRPVQLLKRGKQLVDDQYSLFVGIIFVGLIVGSIAPFGLLLGPMLVGIHLCYLQRERGQLVEFSMVFKGFDQFVDALVATLILMGASMVVIIPFLIAIFAIVLLPIMEQGNQAAPPPEVITAMLTIYPAMLIANLLITLPFLFTFQLIADYKLTGFAAVKASAAAVWKNLGGILWFFLLLMLLTVILAMMCYVPAILFLPISFGSMFVLYRDIFPKEESVVETMVL